MYFLPMCRFKLGVRFGFVSILGLGSASIGVHLGVALVIAFASAFRSSLLFAGVALVHALVRPQVEAQFAHAVCSWLWLHLVFAILFCIRFHIRSKRRFSWIGFGREACAT